MQQENQLYETRRRKKIMIIYTGKDYYDVSRKAANIMSAQIIMKPNAVLGLFADHIRKS